MFLIKSIMLLTSPFSVSFFHRPTTDHRWPNTGLSNAKMESVRAVSKKWWVVLVYCLILKFLLCCSHPHLLVYFFIADSWSQSAMNRSRIGALDAMTNSNDDGEYSRSEWGDFGWKMHWNSIGDDQETKERTTKGTKVKRWEDDSSNEEGSSQQNNRPFL